MSAAIRVRAVRAVRAKTEAIVSALDEFVSEFVSGFPCNTIGHKWVEIPKTLRKSQYSDGERLRFKCERCSLVGGFSS